ncbi:putative major facilitator superfamily transporter [Rosellinia necatrix]|uniref:Molybdate-anion transporter n=1 Tax=Rosellinia necatrix TaxID=77044 RepID=A0A1S8A8C0_ROSNE|nr:putative major facilitator superfamily transporter [Rosellinia necatrix]
MNHYQFYFGGFVALCIGLFVSQPTRKRELERQANSQKNVARDDEHPEARWYEAYALAMAADWLQGPYLFSLYREEYGLAPGLVMNLYLADFVTTAISAYFIGTLSDKYGRKLYCMIYCVSYALSCFLTVVPVTPLLFLGRILGGVSTSILFTVFDSWMVTGFNEGKLAEDGCDLTRTYAATSVVNGLVAILSRPVGELLVWATGTKKSPFLMSAFILWLALQAIWSRWAENYGIEGSSKQTQTRSGQSAWSTLRTPSILAIAFASTMFDGSMNLFALYWIPTLGSLRVSAGELPYSIIYSSFIAASVAASLAFNIIVDTRIVKHSQLLVGVLLVAASSFAKLSSEKTENSAFWLFCLLQACLGIFGPCIGYLKASLIDDEARSTVYSAMRIPSNIFVILSLLVAKGNVNIDGVYTTCSLILVASLTIVWAASLRGMP